MVCLHVYILLFISRCLLLVNSDCLTKPRSRSLKGSRCKFPYRLDGNLYMECTTRAPNTNSTEPRCPTVNPDPESLLASLDASDWGVCGKECDLMRYHSNAELQQAMQTLASQFPHIAYVFVIGVSVSGHPLMGIRITREARKSRSLLKPMIRYIGNIHGNEAMGREVLLHLAHYLLHGYERDDRIRLLLDTTDISILPSMNPDGFARIPVRQCNGKGYKFGADNENRVDLNQDFPTWRDKERWDTDDSYDVFEGRQPETDAIMNWSANEPFVLSINFHDGAVAVTYPFDHYRGLPPKAKGGIHSTPDQDIFYHLAKTYAVNHATMINRTTCSKKAEEGFANGADWLSQKAGGALDGTLQDFSYMFTNNIELVAFLTCCKYPSRHFLTREWENNRESLIAFIEQVHKGIKGLVLYNNRPVKGADIVVWGPDDKVRGRNVTSQEEGEYWRILLPKKEPYRIQAVYDDCLNTGKVYKSTRTKILVTQKRPLREHNLILNPRGKECVRGGLKNKQDNDEHEFGISDLDFENEV